MTTPRGIERGAYTTSLDSLARVRNSPDADAESREPSVLQRLARRAYRKSYSVPLHIQLAELHNSRERYYRNSIYCANEIVQGEDGKLKTRYCNGRLCPICQAIRTAKAMNAYLPTIELFDDPHFLTLTRRTVTGEHLERTVQEMKKEFGLINDVVRKRARINGLRKTEVTCDPAAETFHPHFHLLVDGESVAERVLEQWLKRHRSTARREAQELQRIESTDAFGVRIVFGYVTKLVTTTSRETLSVPVESLDRIVAALSRQRTLQPYGSLFRRSHGVETESITGPVAYSSPTSTRVGELIRWEWEQSVRTWVDRETGEGLTPWH